VFRHRRPGPTNQT